MEIAWCPGPEFRDRQRAAIRSGDGIAQELEIGRSTVSRWRFRFAELRFQFDELIELSNATPRPYLWTKSAHDILANLCDSRCACGLLIRGTSRRSTSNSGSGEVVERGELSRRAADHDNEDFPISISVSNFASATGLTKCASNPARRAFDTSGSCP
jgi:hypothetical protein